LICRGLYPCTGRAARRAGPGLQFYETKRAGPGQKKINGPGRDFLARAGVYVDVLRDVEKGPGLPTIYNINVIR